MSGTTKTVPLNTILSPALALSTISFLRGVKSRQEARGFTGKLHQCTAACFPQGSHLHFLEHEVSANPRTSTDPEEVGNLWRSIDYFYRSEATRIGIAAPQTHESHRISHN